LVAAIQEAYSVGEDLAKEERKHEHSQEHDQETLSTKVVVDDSKDACAKMNKEFSAIQTKNPKNREEIG